MTTILERIETDRTEARRASKLPLVTFLGYLISEARNVGKAAKPPRESTDEEVIAVLRKQIEHNEENVRLTNGEDPNAEWQNKVMNAYLPTQISDDELKTIIGGIMQDSSIPKGPKMIGHVMCLLKENYSGQYHPGRASQITRELLSQE